MKIKELKARQTNVNIVADIVDIGEIRQFEKFGKTGSVATATLKDDSGEIKLSLWNDQIEKVKKGDRVEIKNGYVNEWRNEIQLTTGKFGTIEVIGKSSDEKVQSITDDEYEEKDIIEGGKEETEHVLTPDEKTEEDKFEDKDLDVEEESID